MIKPLIVTLKPTITALVFLLVSSYLQGVLDKAKGIDPCAQSSISSSTIGVIPAVLGTLNIKPDGVITTGYRTLRITAHAAERMSERGVGREVVHLALDQGKLFAYKHARGSGLIKIGYYLPASSLSRAKGVFVAVDQTHQKIITVIRGVPTAYIVRLLRER